MSAPITAPCLCGRHVEAKRDTRYACAVYSCRCLCGLEGPTAEFPKRAAELFQEHWQSAIARQHHAGMRLSAAAR